MSDTSARTGHAITVTIKYGKGYDDTWAIFTGLADQVRQDIVDFFGLDRESGNRLSLSDLVVSATNVAHGVGTLAREFGATPITDPRERPRRDGPQARGAGADPWKQAATVPDSRPESRTESSPAPSLIDLITQASSVDVLKKLWAANQAAFKDPAVMAAWKARGRALTAGTSV